jgi:hypothetical protein
VRGAGACFGAADAAGDLGRDGLPLLRKCSEIGGREILRRPSREFRGPLERGVVSSLLV